MKPQAQMYRDGLIRAIVADRPAMVYPVHQPTVLEDYCNTLADGYEAKRLMVAKGYGAPWMTITEIVRLLPDAGAPRQRNGRKRRR
jgi:hypothetical protein